MCPRISSAESHSQQQWHANPRALNGLTCVALTIHGGKARRDQRGCEPVSPETRERTAAELIWITFLAEILKRAFRHSSSPSRTVPAQSRRTRSRVPRRQRLRQTAPQEVARWKFLSAKPACQSQLRLNGSMCIINPLRGNMKGRGVGREIKRDVSKRPLGISSRCWCDSGGGWSPGPGMHEEFRSNWEGANGQNKRRTLCHSKVILKGSRIVTCYLLGEAGRGRRRRGRSGETPARRFLAEVRRTPSEGLKLSLSPLRRGFIFSRCLPRPREQPRRVPEISPALQKGPLSRVSPRFSWPFPAPLSAP